MTESPTEEQAEKYDRLIPLLRAQHVEFTKLSSKKQERSLNVLKVRNVNRLLQAIDELVAEGPSREYLEYLDEETLPDNSDVVIILSQWLAVLEQYRSEHFGYDGEGAHRWFTVENPKPRGY